MKNNHLLYGTAYYPEYLPYTSLPDRSISHRIQQDMKMMKHANINTIRIAESSWSTWEPLDNQFSFTLLHQIIQGAYHENIQVIVGTPTNAIPIWLAKKFPDILVETHNGPSRFGRRQNMDITNPNYLFHAERMIRRLMEQVVSYPNVIGIQIDNETKSYDTCSDNAQNLFHTYIKEKYHSTERMNEALGLSFQSNRISSWDDLPDIRGIVNASLVAEYEQFKRKLVTDFIAWQAGIVREYLHEEQFVTHNFDFERNERVFGLHPETNLFEAAKCLDIPGFNVYHPSRNLLTGAEISFAGSIARTISRLIHQHQYLVLETQAQGRTEWLPYNNQLRLQAYTHIACGSKSILYWHWHSIHNSVESYWKGILSHDLEENQTYQEVCQIGQEFNQIGELIQLTQIKSNIAILVDNHSLDGMNCFPISETLSYNDVVKWIYDSLYKMNMECDMISVNEKDFDQYKLIILPCLYSVDEETIQRLINYVENGGHLLATFKTAFSNEHLQIYCSKQPYELTKCFGMTYDQFTYPNETEIRVELPDEILSFSVPASEWMELLRPTTAEIWGAYSDSDYAAITHNHYGNGSCTYVGTYFQSSVLEQIIQALCTEAGIKLKTVTYPIIRKSGINANGQRIIYYFNYSDSKQSVPCTVKNAKIILLNNTITNQEFTPGEYFDIEPWNLMIVEKELS